MSPVRATPLCRRIRLSPLQGSFCLVRANPGLHPGLCAKGRAFSPRVERWLCKNNSRPRVLHSVDKRLTPAPKGLQVPSSRPPQGDKRSTCAPRGLQVPGPRPSQGQQAFNARPEGAMSSQPRASERSERHPGLGRAANDTPPEGAKAVTGRISLGRLNVPAGVFTSASAGLNASVVAFAPSGGVSERILRNPGCRFAALACPGLGACCPSGARVERLEKPWLSSGARVERGLPSRWSQAGSWWSRAGVHYPPQRM